MVMSGGGALLRNIDRLLTQVTGVPCHVAESPLNCVAVGTGLAAFPGVSPERAREQP